VSWYLTIKALHIIFMVAWFAGIFYLPRIFVYHAESDSSEVRAQLGFSRGRVLRRLGDSGTQPEVIWECTYPDLAAREREVQAVEATAEFQAVMQHMRTLICRFDRQIWRVSTEV